MNDRGDLVAVLTSSTLKEKSRNPPRGLPSLDKHGRLLCGAAIGTREIDRDRAVSLARVGVDALILDSSQGDSIYQLQMSMT